MKKHLKVWQVILLALACCLMLAANTFAASNVPIGSTRVKWNLKSGKTITVKTNYADVGMKKAKIKISRLKKKRYGGRFNLSFDVTFDYTPFKPSKSQVHRMVNSDFFDENDDIGGTLRLFVVDYYTGRNLEEIDEDWYFWSPWDEYYDSDYYSFDEYAAAVRQNHTGVTVNSRLKKSFGKKTYRDRDGCYVWLRKQTYHYDISYPVSYNGLCIGVGGCPYLYKDVEEEKFLFGINGFANLRDYQYNPSNWHFMKVK